MDTTTETTKGDANETKHTNGDAKKGRQPRSFTEKMPCALSVEERAERSSLLADHYADIEGLEAERKNTNDRFKAQIEIVEQSIREMARTLKSKTELREVELIEEFIFATNTVRVSRADTKEVVRERAMTRNERQEELPLPKTDAKPEKKSGKSKDAKADTSDAEIKDPEKVLGVIDGGKSTKKKTGRKDSSS